MKKYSILWIGLILLVLCVSITCHKDKFTVEPTHAFEWVTDTPESQQMDSDVLEGAIEEALELGFVNSLIMARHGVMVAEIYFNGYSHETARPIQSSTKSITSALIGLAMAHGLIDSLEQTVFSFFPEFDKEDLDPRTKEITLWHLLTMTSGYPSDDVVNQYLDLNSTTALEGIFDLPLFDDPGADFRYSSAAVHLLSGVIFKTTGMYARDFADRYLCQPLEIDIYSWPADDEGHHFGGTGMWITPRDLARFGQLYLDGGLIDGQQILPAAWIETSVTDALGGGGSWGELKDLGYGYLWWTGTIRDHRAFLAIGYAGQNIVAFPDLDLLVVTTAGFPTTESGANQQYLRLMELIADHVLPAVTDT